MIPKDTATKLLNRMSVHQCWQGKDKNADAQRKRAKACAHEACDEIIDLCIRQGRVLTQKYYAAVKIEIDKL
jgi:hypothetical protein